MENDPRYSQDWFDNLRRKLQENLDLRYILRDGSQKLINAAVIGAIGLILSSVLAALVAIFTGVIKP